MTSFPPLKRAAALMALGALSTWTTLPGCTAARLTAQSRTGCDQPLQVMKTADGVPFLRTPDACFADLPDWPYTSKYVELNGLRQAYVDEGPADGEVIVMLHGQPSWGYLYRHMIPTLTAAGHRVIVMDHLGMGRSDKPVDLAFHSFKRHAQRFEAFLDALQLQTPTLFAQDWGSVIGLYVAAGRLDAFKRIIIGNGGLPVVTERSIPPQDVERSNAAFADMMAMMPDHQPRLFDDEGNSLLPMPDDAPEPALMFGQWSTFARTSDDFVPSVMLEALTYDALTPKERYAYDAPFPRRELMAAPRTFPSLRDELLGITQSRVDALATYDRPFLTIFGRNDPGLVGEGDGQDLMIDHIPGAKGMPHQRLQDASHFFQDDKGPEVAAMVVAFMRDNP